MQARVTLVGAAAIPCGRIQRPRDAALQALEHEALAGCAIVAMRDAGLPKEAIGALVFTHPRPYTQQDGFAVGKRAEIVVLAYEDGPLFAARVLR